MDITLSMIQELLELPCTSHIDPANKQVFQGVQLLLSQEELSATDILYVTCLQLAATLHEKGIQIYCLCPCEAAPAALLRPDNYTVIANSPHTLTELYQQVNNCFYRLKSWDFNMYHALMNKEDLQDLLNRSQDILKNHIHIVEPFSRLLAYTKDIDIEDVDINTMYSSNLEKPDALLAFQQLILDNAQTASDGLYLLENNLFVHPTVTKSFCAPSGYQLFTVMLCKNRPLSPGTQDLFLHLCKYIQIYCENMLFSQQQPATQASFINGILEGTLSKNAINIHATLSLNLPIKSTFNLYQVICRVNTKKNLEKLMEEISTALPLGVLSQYQDSIVILNQYEDDNFSRCCRSNYKALLPVLTKHSALCGISNPFHTLYEADSAFRQAHMVLKTYGLHTGSAAFPFMPPHQASPVFLFDTYSLYYSFWENKAQKEQLFLLAPYQDSIIAIKNYDKKYSTRCLETLYVCLTNEMSFTAASEYLHISREMVSHAIHSITPLVFGSLDTWSVRLKLLMAFEYLNLHPELL